jgi:YVTN family beta-propeller protein
VTGRLYRSAGLSSVVALCCILVALLSGSNALAFGASLPITAYVTNVSDDTVTPIDLTTNTSGSPIAVGSVPRGVAVTPTGTTVYVANQFGDSVTPVDIASHTPGSPIPVGSYPIGIAITPNGQTAYVANSQSDTVTPIDVATNTAGSPISVGPGAFWVAITPDGQTAYVTTNLTNTVTPIDVATGTAGTPIWVGGQPAGIAITPNGQTAYVAIPQANQVVPIDLVTSTAGTPIPVGGSSVPPFGGGPTFIAITPDGKTAYVSNHYDDSVTPIDVATNAPGSPISAGPNPLGLAISPDGKTVYAANFGSNTVTPIDVATDTAGAPITVGQNPYAIAIAPVLSASGPATVTLSPPDAVNNVGTQHTVTATVKDAAGGAVQGSSVLFSVQGADTASGSCATDASGQCSFTYQGPLLPGADLITGCLDADGSGTVDAGEPCGAATKAWVLPTTTAGQATGGGQILNASGNDQIAFGFNAKSDAMGIRGECTLVDPSTRTKVKCLDATTLVRSGAHATFFGNATLNGTSTKYRIDIDDLGEPGRGRDTFKLQVSSGYTVGGTLVSGNIQIHQ